ncbi:tyrosine-protein kinase baz1b [Phtheirospermum japonicum]|uniref:Tyrosine-protein kinase baz1b n=1 Tax=Phtheirospermum japonicum TaxID=374723 RepID=A0A830DAV7_9LAMI|nr:tyrosine-protein kinase baz1b [Phtheirospermum japonicum]
MKSNDEFAGETCAENIEIRQPSVLSTVAGMNSTSDSFSENAVGKTSSRTSNASASDDGVVHSKSEDRKVSEGHDDCMSCVSGTDEHANKKRDPDDVMMKYNKLSKVSGENSDKVPPSSLKTGLNSQDLGILKSIDAATGLLKVQNTYSQASNGKCVSHHQNPSDVKDDKPSATKKEPLEGSTEVWDSLSPKVAAAVVCGDPLATALNPIEKNDDMEVEIQSIDETGDSDMVEQDVKVCDICGDAGREDLLAICCRCSDGAEHTYCMREMLAKVPEGDWLCEECQAQEHAGNGREEKIGRMDENEKNNSGHTSSEHVNNSDAEGQRTKGSMRFPSKRNRDDDDAEVSSILKKPALESKLGSPRPSNAGKTATLSRENSSKNLDKGRLQSSDIVPVNDTTESASSASDQRLHNFRGTFSKSNSFNSLNSKPKVKLVDQVVIQRQKSAKEPSSFRHKEGVVRTIGKSMSFKSTNAGRSESKVKMLSPRPSHVQDIKNTKQRGPLERQQSFRTERSSINSTIGASVSPTSRIDKRPASRGESSSLATIANHHETKSVQAEGKSAALSRSSSLAARKTADLPSSSGEFKRPSMHVNSTFGVTSTNGVNNNEHKYNQNTSKEDSSCPVVAERPPFDGNEGIPDGLPRHRDLTNSGERMKDCSGSRSGPPSAKLSRDEGGSNLKAAIEAAVLRKPGMFRKHSSVSTLGCEVAASHQDPIKKKLSSDAELPERPTLSRNLTVDTLKKETSNFVKPSSLVPVDGVHINSSTRNMLSNSPAAMPFFLKSVAVPEHEYIWQGSFEICRSGKTSDAWDGIQAHLSTCASPKVIEAVNKFNSRIVLYEVPRSSTWPMHFQEHGVREDNIALFFFAKDLESYDKIYKVLLDNMMKNDLALKGNVNGVELLIFPSSQLPDNSQRWNMLFFLWGVFRGKKESCLQQQMPQSLNQICVPRNIPSPIMSLPENRCSLRPIAEDGSEEDAARPVLGVSASEELHRLLSSRVSSRDCDNKSLEHRLNASTSPAVHSDNANRCLEMAGASQEGKGDTSSSCSPPLAMGSNSSSGMKQMLMQPDTTTLTVADQVKSRLGDLIIEDRENLLMDNYRDTRDLNKWPFNHNERMLPAGPSSVLPPALRHADAGHVRVDNDTCGGALEKMNHLVLVDRDEGAERRFFPTESQGIQLATPWKVQNLLEQGDRAPDLELALGGAETKSLTLVPLDFVGGNNGKVNELQRSSYREDEATAAVAAGIKAEDDVAASLSLSLSFPFPDKELSPKAAPKNEQRERVNTSMLLFGNLREN